VGEVLDVVEVDRKDVEPADLEPELGPTARSGRRGEVAT
jgi:hypothetical protein